MTDALSPGIQTIGEKRRPKIGEYQVRTTTRESTACDMKRKWNGTRSFENNSLLGGNQRSHEHTPKVLSSLMVTLVLEMPRNYTLTLLVLVAVTSRVSGITTAQ